MIDETLKKYGSIVANHPFLILGIAILVTIAALIGASSLGMKEEGMEERLPQDIEVISTMNFVKDEFSGGINPGNIVIELDPILSNSSEIRDVRDTKIIEYADILAKKAEKLEDIQSASSIADLLRENDHLPRSERRIRSKLDSLPQTTEYISDDYSMTLIRLDLMPDADNEEVYYQLCKIIEETPKPPGVKAQPSGSFAVIASLKQQIKPDMRKTSIFSILGILAIIFLFVFRSLKHGITSLMAIVFGVLWAFGLMGILGMNLSSVTAGAASMMMGIGIDFGIQVVSRFRQELMRFGYMEAVINTISGVTVPMAVTTLAALIGFRAMSLGRLTFLADLATMMSLGVLCCMLSAITIIPALLVIWEKYFGKG